MVFVPPKLETPVPPSATASIFSPLTSTYQNLNQKITSFFGSTYLKVVETVIPGLDRQSPREDAQDSQLAQDLEQTKKELKQLKEEGLVVKEVTKEVTKITQIQPVKEITREVIKIDDTKLIVIEGDVSKLQSDLASLTATVSSSNLSFTSSRLNSLESFIISNNKTASVSSTNNTQIKYLLDNISAISLELQTHSDRVGLLVNQRGTSHIIQFQDSGTDILTIADGGATTFTSQNSQIQLNAGTGEIDLTTTGTIDINSGTTSISGVLSLGTVLAISSGGTGAVTFTDGGILLGSGTGAITATAVLANGQLLIGDGTGDPVLATLTGTANEITVTNGAGTITLDIPDSPILTTPTLSSPIATSTLIIRHTSAGDPILQFQDNTTNTWFLGFDNSDANKFRITPGGNFNATSSGITINLAGFVGIGTTNPSVALDISGALTVSGAIVSATLDTGQGANELYDMDQNVLTSSAVTFATIDTGQGANELYDMDQNVLTTSAVTFATLDTGQGANELYDMDQNVLTTSSPTFNAATITNALTAAALTATTTLTINHTSAGDPYINFEDNTTDTWYLGFDNSDANKFRITPAGLFNATSSGLTINLAGFVGIGTTNPSVALDITGALTVSGAVTITSGSITGITDLAVADGGTGVSNFGGTNTILYTSSADTLASTSTLSVPLGGSGASTFTDGGILLGSGTGAITATAVLADGEFIVGDGTTDPVLESGATLRTSLGLGLTDSVTFTALTATTTLTINHTSAGDPYINFEDNGTDTWFLGFDNSDANKFRITPGGLFNATSSGITINLAGFVGIGTTNPSVALDITGALTVSGAATLSSTLAVTGIATFSNTTTSINGISYGWPSSDGTVDQVLSTNGSRVLSWATSGGLFTDGGATTYLTATTDDLALGSSTANGPFLFDVSASELTINHNSGDPSIAFQTASTTRWLVGVDDSQSGDPFRIARGSAFNATTSGIMLDINGNVGIGTTGPDRTLDVFHASNPQLRITQSDSTEYSDFQVAASTGDLTVSASGEDITLIQDPAGTTGANLWVCEGAACSSINIATRVNFITSGTTTTAWGSATDAGGNILPENAIIFDNEYILIPGTENATSVLMMFGPSSSTAPIIIFDQVVP